MKLNAVIPILLILLTGCATGGLLQAGVDAAFDDLDILLSEFEQVFPVGEHDIANFRVGRSEQLSPSTADELNGIQEEWCLTIDYVAHNIETDEYTDHKAVYLLGYDGNDWNAQISEEWGTYENDLEDYEHVWGLCLVN